MKKRRILFISILSAIVVCGGIFSWYIQRQKTYAKTREVFAPYYNYSGKLSEEEQTSLTDFIISITEEVEPSELSKYKLPKRERLQLEAHSMTLHRDNPELFLMKSSDTNNINDVKPWQMHFSILALTAKTKLADIPSSSRSQMLNHIESLNKRLARNSVEAYVEASNKKVKQLPPGPHPKLTPLHSTTLWLTTIEPYGGDQWIMEADGSFHLPEGAKRGGIHITDIYGNEYTVDFDEPTNSGLTEDTTALYAEIDRVYEHLTDAEFQRLSSLSKSDRHAKIEMIFSTE